ncbi:hypothetical protein ABBQ32_005672 [Trebouxia sp. C0010 RCD-2024]
MAQVQARLSFLRSRSTSCYPEGVLCLQLQTVQPQPAAPESTSAWQQQQGMEVLENLNQQHQKRQESLVVHATSAPDLDDLEEQIEQLQEELEEQAAENSQLQEKNTQLREEKSDLKTKNGRLVLDNEELQRTMAATSRLLTEAHAANHKLQDQLATALQAGMDLVQQLAEATRVSPRKVSSDPPAKPACGLLGYATNNMGSPWEADLQWGKLTPGPLSTLTKGYRWMDTNACLDRQAQSIGDASSPLPTVLDLTWTPSKLLSPTPSGAFSPIGVRSAMPGAMSNLSSSPVWSLSHAPSLSTAEESSSLLQANVESAQLATTPLSQLLVGRRVTDTRSFMSTPFPADVQAMLAEVSPVTPTSGPFSPLTRSVQINHQALCWGNTLVEVGGPAYVAGLATPLPSMQTPTPIDFEATLMDVPSRNPSPVCAPGLTVTAQTKIQALTEVNCKADIGGQHYFAGDASPLPSKLEGDSSWSPSNFLAPTPLGANTTEDTLSVLVDGLPTLSVMGTPPPPAGADPVLKHKSFSTQSPARLSGLTLTAKAKNQVIQLFLSHLEMPSTCP